ncbi:MAG TPA: class I SAM-dependent methyltransferase [Fibrobacteraceae bacterium]|nr:class I SAM-dependent methyltransferase [Fibrobacteraceae bacterium]
MVSNLVSNLQDCAQKRASIAAQTNAYRVINGIADGFPGVVLDRYGDHWQLQFYRSDWMDRESLLCEAIQIAFSPEFLVVKNRLDRDGRSLERPKMHVAVGNENAASCEVREGEARFHVDLLDTVNPGLFLDMRDHRIELASLSCGGDMLNLFCYTGSFSVHARLAGATRAVNVDISAKILSRARENYLLNGIQTLRGEFFRGTAGEYLRYAVRKGLRFRIVVLDPPSFSHSAQGSFQVRQDLESLVRLCAQVVEAQGFLFVSTNHSQYRPHLLADFVHQWTPNASKILWMRGQSMDFSSNGSQRESCLSAVLVQMT